MDFGMKKATISAGFLSQFSQLGKSVSEVGRMMVEVPKSIKKRQKPVSPVTFFNWGTLGMTGAAEGFSPVVYKPLKGLYNTQLGKPFAGRWTAEPSCAKGRVNG